MTTPRLGTMLLAFGLALASMLSVQPANATLSGTDYGQPATDPNGFVYCVSPYFDMHYPDCVPPPAASRTYKGQPVSVYDKKKVPWGTMRASVNVLRNDAIEKKAKIREIDITRQNPKTTGLRTWVYDNKIWFEMKSGQHLGFLPGGLTTIYYRVIDAKGRASYPVYVQLKIT